MVELGAKAATPSVSRLHRFHLLRGRVPRRLRLPGLLEPDRRRLRNSVKREPHRPLAATLKPTFSASLVQVILRP